jgi:hypothetical protein
MSDILDLFENQEDPSELFAVFRAETQRIMSLVKTGLEYSGNEFEGLNDAIEIFINNTCNAYKYNESTYHNNDVEYKDQLEWGLINVRNIGRLVLTTYKSAAFDSPEGGKVILSMLTSARFHANVDELELVNLDEYES